MNILVSGCSFSQWPQYPGGPNTCWPRYFGELNPGSTITSVAEAAAGNQYICDSVIRAVLENPDHFDQVLVMWSGISRLDYLTDVTDPAWDALFDSYGFYRRLTNRKLGYIFSGGQLGTWFKNPVAHKMFYEMYKVSSNVSLATINIQEIIKLQSFLDSKKIKYKFMTYVNYWGSGENISPNGDFGVADIPEVDFLVKAINWDNWIFTNDQKDGLYELAKSTNDFMPDGFHPGPTAHESWARFVNDRLN